MLYLTWIVNFLVPCFAFEYSPVIELPQGKIQGLENKRENIRKYLCIPYASVVRRYVDAGPAPHWEGIRDVSSGRISCPQYVQQLKLAIGEEECLVLNVNTPSFITKKDQLPVMVFLHGGGFMTDSNNDYFYNPLPLVKEGVIVVTINYRIGAFGFLCLKLKGAPGNVGLKDQIKALKWVKNNIHYFGGNPNEITIFGESSGAKSISFLMLSRKTEGLFKNAILQGGSALSPVSLSIDPIKVASTVAYNMGHITGNPHKLLEIFKNASMEDILAASTATISDNPFSMFTFRPCIEEGTDDNALITKLPKQHLEEYKSDRVSFIIGFNSLDAIAVISNNEIKDLGWFSDNFEKFLPENLHFRNKSEREDVMYKIKSYYSGSDESCGNTGIRNLINYFSDILFHYPSILLTKYLLRNRRVSLYNYMFEYDSPRNFLKPKSNVTITGASHADELSYLFKFGSQSRIPISNEDEDVSYKMTKLWTNFAKFSDPTPYTTHHLPLKWEPSQKGGLKDLRFMRIDKKLKMSSLPNLQRIEFWRNIYDKYGF